MDVLARDSVFLDVGKCEVVVIGRGDGDGEGAGEGGQAACFPGNELLAKISCDLSALFVWFLCPLRVPRTRFQRTEDSYQLMT